MATATITGFQCGNGNWNYYNSSYTRGNSHYVDYTSYSVKTRGKITVAPDSGKKITGITLTTGVVRSGATNLYCYLLSSEPTSLTTAPSSYLARARYPSSGTSNPTASGAMWSFSLTGLSITSSTTLYLWFCTVDDISGAYTQIWDKVSGAVTSQAYLTLTQVAMTASISYNGNGYTGGTLPGSGSYNIGSSYTVSSNTLTHSDTNGYVISFNVNGGSGSVSAITQKIGWTHDYWTLNSTSGTRYNKGASFTVPSSASTFYAHWATSRKAITLPSAPTAPTGKYFTGWYTASSGGSKAGNAGASWTPDATRTLYAQWAWNTYTIKYNGNGNTGGTVPSNQTKTYGVTLTLSSTKLTHSSDNPSPHTVTFKQNGGNAPSPASVTSASTRTWTHSGWATSASGSKAYNLGGSYTANAAATLYAYWDKSTTWATITTPTCTRGQSSGTARTVTFNANGGSCSTTSLSSACTLTWSSTGWWTATSGGTKRCSNGGSYKPTQTETVYAQWTSSASYAAITLPTATKSGYNFLGWATSSSATSGTTGSYTPPSNITLYAVFGQNVLTINKDGWYQGDGTNNNQDYSLATNATLGIQDGAYNCWGWGGWYWNGSYTWKNFGYTNYCASVYTDGNRRTGAFNDANSIALSVYNNDSTNRPHTSSYVGSVSGSGAQAVLRISFPASTSTSAFGFYGPLLKNPNQTTTQYATKNSRWIHCFRAKLPVGYYFWPARNNIGSDYQCHWLSDNAGTGDFYNYAYATTFGTGTSGWSTSASTIGFVRISSSANTGTSPTTAVSIDVAFSLMTLDEAFFTGNRTLTMAGTNMSIRAQGFKKENWTYELPNGGTLVDDAFRYRNYGVAMTVTNPTRDNYAFKNWTRIYATNLFLKTYKFINTTSGNTFNTHKIQIYNFDRTGSATLVANNSATTVSGTWTCNLSTGWYYCCHGMNGSTKDLLLGERIYLVNNALYGYYWERVNNTAGQNITINNFIFGRQDATTTTSYGTTNNYALWLKANWTARTKVYINANGGWLNLKDGYNSYYKNDTTTPFGRLIRTDSPYNNGQFYYEVTYGAQSDLPNWNNPSWLNLIRYGYYVPTGEEFYNSAGSYFAQDVNYTAQTFTPTLTEETPVNGEVFVNWLPDTYTFTLNRVDATAVPDTSTTSTYGDILVLPADIKEHYDFMGWFKYFTSNDFIYFGRDYMWNDMFAAHFTAYHDDWTTYDSTTRLMTCATSGGWSITPNSDDGCIQISLYKDGAWVRAKSSITFQQLSPGFHDFDIVFTGSEERLYLDDTLIASSAIAAPIQYRATASTTTQLIVGKGAQSMSATNPYGANYSSMQFNGYIGNIVVKHQATKIDSTEARTQWITPAHNITLTSLFKEESYTNVTLSGIGNGVVEYNSNLFHNGDSFKVYHSDLTGDNFEINIYPPTAQLITSYTTSGSTTNRTTMISTTVSASTTSNLKDLSKVITVPCVDNIYRQYNLSTTYEDIPVLRYQYLLVDDQNNYFVDDQDNSIKVTVKYIPYRYNTSTSSWQRCEPRGYSNGWKLGG